MKQRTWDTILKLKETGEIQRMGILFSTERKDYLYDTGTGKVVELKDEEQKIFDALFDAETSLKQAEEMIIKFDKQEQLLDFICSEHLLDNPVIKRFIELDGYYEEEVIEIKQLIIELTERCNLRCKYCIYNEYNKGNRDFANKDISFDTAKRAMDYAYKHRNPEQFAITFYGGEPLLNFKVMRQCIDYALENFTDCDLSFSFTTNLTLMTEEIAEYLAKVPNLSIVLSMDGPAQIHNMARVYSNNKPTFADVYRGLQYIAKAALKYGRTSLIFNAVLMPPYTEERFDQISDFFSNMDFLPVGTSVRASYPSPKTVPESYYAELQEKGYSLDTPDNLVEWVERKSKGKDFLKDKLNLYADYMQSSLVKIHNRIVLETPAGFSHFNGCCIPGQRRIYVCTDGKYKICEKIGNSPNIGDVDKGLDITAIKKNYLKEYECASIEFCSKCWALRLCDICYANCYNENGMDIQMKCSYCDSIRARYKNWLIKYYETVESDMELIKRIDKIIIS